MTRGLLTGIIAAAIGAACLTYYATVHPEHTAITKIKGPTLASASEASASSTENPAPQPVAIVKQRPTQGQATLGGPFTLTDQFGKTRRDGEFKGRYMVVYFGYSFCPDICPAALYNLTQALQDLSPKELKKVAPVFITIDPERDTVENLKTYMENFHPAIIALTGTQQQLDPVLKAYRVYAQKANPAGTSADYLVDHSSIVYVMDNLGRYVTSFNHQTDPQTIVNILRGVLGA